MRQQCPNDERMIDYIEGRLAEKDRSDLERHLSVCEMCLEALVITNNMGARGDLYELELPPAAVTDTAVKLAADRARIPTSGLIDSAGKFFSNLGSYFVKLNRVWPWGNWNAAPVRGNKVATSQDYVCLEVSFKNLKTEIEIEKTGTSSANIRLRLNEPAKNHKSWRVTLKNGDRELASYLLDGTYVYFEDIPFGHCSISLAGDNEVLGTYSFEIKDSDHGRK